MTIDALYPFAGNHAIQSTAFVFSWPNPLTSAELTAIEACHEHLKDSFSTVQKAPTVNIEITDTGVNQRHDDFLNITFVEPNPELGPGGITRMVRFAPDHMHFAINDYTRWDETWPRLLSWLKILLPVILQGRPLTSTVLQYNDVFEWRGDPAEMILDEIFRAKNDYLSSKIMNSNSLWHSYQGYLEEHTTPRPYRLIENVNISMTEKADDKMRAVTVLTSHHATLHDPIWAVDKALEEMTVLLDDLHEKNKAVLKAVLTDAVCEKINLTS